MMTIMAAKFNMQRKRVFEFNDQAWLPLPLRQMFNKMLYADVRGGVLYDVLLPQLATRLKLGEYQSIHDLAAGDGKLWQHLAPALKTLDVNVPVRLSDLYPPKTFELDLQPGGLPLEFMDEPQDLRNLSFTGQEFLTLFAGLHQFNPGEVRELFNKVAGSGSGFFAVEFTHRKDFGVKEAVQVLRSAELLARRVKQSSATLHWLTRLPYLVSKMYTWDVMVSRARSYTGDELTEFTQNTGNASYLWRVDQILDPVSGTVLQYVLGCKI